jgi:hypothetical protein
VLKTIKMDSFERKELVMCEYAVPENRKEESGLILSFNVIISHTFSWDCPIRVNRIIPVYFRFFIRRKINIFLPHGWPSIDSVWSPGHGAASLPPLFEVGGL